MSGRSTCVAGIAALALASTGCTLYDGRQLEFVALAPMPVGSELAYRVKASRGVKTAVTAVDGGAGVSVPTNTDLRLDVSALGEGVHWLTAAASFEREMQPATLRLAVERGSSLFQAPGIARAVPAPGGLVAPSPFVVELTFSRVLDPEELEATFVDAAGAPLATSVAATSPRSLRLVLGSPLERAGQVQARAKVKSLNGLRASVSAGPWSAFHAHVTFDSFPLATNGTAKLQLHASGVETALLPGQAILLAGGVPVATLGAQPWPPVAWDTGSFAEGRYLLSAKVPGWADDGSWSAGPTVTVDRTPPRITCVPRFGRTDEIGVHEGLFITSDEPLWGSIAPAILVDGVPHPTQWIPGPGPWDLNLGMLAPRPVPPVTLAATLGPDAIDQAGNPAVVPATCSFASPAWLSPWGQGPLATEAGAILAEEVALQWDALSLGLGTVLDLAFVPPAGQPDAGRVMLTRATARGPGAVPSTMSSARAATSSLSLSRGLLAWTERLASGPGQVHAVSWGGPAISGALNRVATHDASHGAVGAYLDPYLAQPMIVWSEDDGAGGRAIRTLLYLTTWMESGGDVRSAPGAVADFPSLSVNSPGPDIFIDQFLAFLETVPGGVAQVRTASAKGLSPWSAVPGSWNADPVMAASEPSGYAGGGGTLLAWVEGGKVWARQGDWGGPALGPASALNVEPAHLARSPRATSEGVVVFVEAGAAGDEVWARRWDGRAWALLPGPLNAGASGPVRSLAVHAGSSFFSPVPAVAWVDQGGRVFVRVGNW